MNTSLRAESHVRAMSAAQLKDSKRTKNAMLMLDFNETTNQLAMANSVLWCGYVVRNEDGHVLRYYSLRIVSAAENHLQAPAVTPQQQQQQQLEVNGERKIWMVEEEIKTDYLH